MRRRRDVQLDLAHIMPRNRIAQEFAEVSRLLDACPDLLDIVQGDLVGHRHPHTGREGMTAEQVLRSAVLKQTQGLTYEEMAFRLSDSQTLRAFVRLRTGQVPSASALQDNLSALTQHSWQTIHRRVLALAHEEQIESGERIRIDATGVETNIHDPSDSTLLWDGIRVLTRLMSQGKNLTPTPAYRFSDHTRVAKRRVREIQSAKGKKARRRAYRDLLHYAGQVRGYVLEAMGVLRTWEGERAQDTQTARGLAARMQTVLGLLDQVIDQTHRRVIRGESVPASEKIVSLFETHTDILVKGTRDIVYGHKVCLAGGSSGLVTGVLVCDGNPADSDLFQPMLDRHIATYGVAPIQTAADGAFASKANLRWAKAQGVEDVCFAKKRGLNVLEMVKNTRIYRKLRNFRAAMEAVISTLKRRYRLARCPWSGWEGFGCYVWSTVVAYNLFTMARYRLAEQ